MPLLAKDLKAHAGKSVVIPGLYQDPSVIGSGTGYQQCPRQFKDGCFFKHACRLAVNANQIADFKALVADLNAGKVDWLVILNANPIYDAPADLDFATAFDKAKTVAHLGSHVDETGQIAHWHIPAAHYLESWSDARAYDGTVSIVQPMIDPLYGGKTAHDVLQALLNEPGLSAYEAVRETWKPVIKGDFEDGLAQGAARRAGLTARHTMSVPTSAVDYACAVCSVKVPTPSSEGFDRNHLPPRSEYLRRAMVECGLAAGAAQAGHQSELG